MCLERVSFKNGDFHQESTFFTQMEYTLIYQLSYEGGLIMENIFLDNIHSHSLPILEIREESNSLSARNQITMRNIVI